MRRVQGWSLLGLVCLAACGPVHHPIAAPAVRTAATAQDELASCSPPQAEALTQQWQALLNRQPTSLDQTPWLQWRDVALSIGYLAVSPTKLPASHAAMRRRALAAGVAEKRIEAWRPLPFAFLHAVDFPARGDGEVPGRAFVGYWLTQAFLDEQGHLRQFVHLSGASAPWAVALSRSQAGLPTDLCAVTGSARAQDGTLDVGFGSGALRMQGHVVGPATTLASFAGLSPWTSLADGQVFTIANQQAGAHVRVMSSWRVWTGGQMGEVARTLGLKRLPAASYLESDGLSLGADAQP